MTTTELRLEFRNAIQTFASSKDDNPLVEFGGRRVPFSNACEQMIGARDMMPRQTRELVRELAGPGRDRPFKAQGATYAQAARVLRDVIKRRREFTELDRTTTAMIAEHPVIKGICGCLRMSAQRGLTAPYIVTLASGDGTIFATRWENQELESMSVIADHCGDSPNSQRANVLVVGADESALRFEVDLATEAIVAA